MKIASIILISALVGAPVLRSQDLYFGFQCGINSPQSDVKNQLNLKAGFNLGGNMFIDLGNGHAIAPRVDYTTFSGKSFVNGIASPPGFPAPGYPLYGKGQFNSLALVVDYDYFLNGKTTKGPYLLVGIGATPNRYTLDETSDPSIPAPIPGHSGHKNAMVFDGGMGYLFSPHFGVDIKYLISNFGGGDMLRTAEAHWINLGLVTRF